MYWIWHLRLFRKNVFGIQPKLPTLIAIDTECKKVMNVCDEIFQ